MSFTVAWGCFYYSSCQEEGERKSNRKREVLDFTPCRLNGGCKECLKGAEAQM